MRRTSSAGLVRGWCLAGAIVLLASPSRGAVSFHRLSAEAVRTALSGHALRDEAHWSYRFLGDGALDAVDLGQRRKGTWRITYDELCIALTIHRKVETDCYQVWQSAERVELRRDGVVILQGQLAD